MSLRTTGTKSVDPIIVMGMHKSGTTLLAEMVHKGGTPMFAGNHTPDYEGGIKYERPICQQINRAILGLQEIPYSLDPIWKIKPRALTPEEKATILEETRDEPWGFKDPRTTITYPVWAQVFSGGPRLYVFRSHQEVMQRYAGKVAGRKKFRRMRRALIAWMAYNTAVLRNLRLDQEAGRPCALVRYEELMDEPELIARVEQLIGVKLFDARNWDLRRNKRPGQAHLFFWLTFGLAHRVQRLYRQLTGASVKRS